MKIIKNSIKWALNHISRSKLQRVSQWCVPIVGLIYIGRGKECPICGCKRRKFLPYGYVTQRENALCPSCLSLERHRMLWHYIKNSTSLLSTLPRILHIAPEICLKREFEKLYIGDKKYDYVTADLESPLADMHFDIQHIPICDQVVDVVICNHILEHVQSDITAIKEIYRILKPNGYAIILSPIDLSRDNTFEDDTITNPEERTKLFGQYDHRRVYGKDYVKRVIGCGFEVEDIDYSKKVGEEIAQKYAFCADHLYIARKRG